MLGAFSHSWLTGLWWLSLTLNLHGRIASSLGSRNSKCLDENRRMSSFVQGVGYTVSAGGPLLIGFIHETADSWSPALAVLSGVSLLFIGTGAGVYFIRSKNG